MPKKLRWLIIGLSSLAILAACAPAGESDGGAEPPAAEAPAVEEMEAAPDEEMAVVGGLCAHPYFPALEGTTWSYAGEADGAAYAFEDTIIERREDGFTMSSDFGDVTQNLAWECSEDGLVALSYGGGGAASVSARDFAFTMNTLEVTGVTLPAEILPGDTWEQTYIIEGTQVLDGEQFGTMEGSAVIFYTAVGMETISVSAGEFSGLHIRREITLDFTVSVMDLTIPTVMVLAENTWFVEGVGMVYSEGSGTLDEFAFDTTLELQEYTFP